MRMILTAALAVTAAPAAPAAASVGVSYSTIAIVQLYQYQPISSQSYFERDDDRSVVGAVASTTHGASTATASSGHDGTTVAVTTAALGGSLDDLDDTYISHIGSTIHDADGLGFLNEQYRALASVTATFSVTFDWSLRIDYSASDAFTQALLARYAAAGGAGSILDVASPGSTFVTSYGVQEVATGSGGYSSFSVTSSAYTTIPVTSGGSATTRSSGYVQTFVSSQDQFGHETLVSGLNSIDAPTNFTLTGSRTTQFDVSFVAGRRYERNIFSLCEAQLRDAAYFLAGTKATCGGSVSFGANDGISNVRDLNGDAYTLPFLVADDTPVSNIPEPATWALLLTGFTAVGAAARARRRPSRPIPPVLPATCPAPPS